MRNLTYIQVTNLAVQLAKSKQKNNEDIVVVGAEGYTKYAPSGIICLNDDLTTYLDNNKTTEKILVLVRVFEHLDMTVQYWYREFIKSNVKKIVAVTPDMEDTLTRINFNDYYHVFRSEFEIFNEWNHNDSDDWFYNSHKWFVSEHVLQTMPSMYNYIEDFVNVNGFQHIISYHEITLPKQNTGGFYTLPRSIEISDNAYIETDKGKMRYEIGNLDFLLKDTYQYIKFHNVLCKDKLIRFPWYLLKHYLDENPNTYVEFEEYDIYAKLSSILNYSISSSSYQIVMNNTYRKKCMSLVNKEILNKVLKYEDLLNHVIVKFI